MEKEEKLKALVSCVKSSGFSWEEIIAYLSKNPALLKTVGPDEATTDDVCPGMYYYSDGTVSAKVLPEKQISGVIGSFSRYEKTGLAFVLREAVLTWDNARKWFSAYAFDGLQPWQVSLPTSSDLLDMFRHFDEIQEALLLINRPLLRRDHYLTSSTWKYDPNLVFIIAPWDNYADMLIGKKAECCVRGVFAFKMF